MADITGTFSWTNPYPSEPTVTFDYRISDTQANFTPIAQGNTSSNSVTMHNMVENTIHHYQVTTVCSRRTSGSAATSGNVYTTPIKDVTRTFNIDFKCHLFYPNDGVLEIAVETANWKTEWDKTMQNPETYSVNNPIVNPLSIDEFYYEDTFSTLSIIDTKPVRNSLIYFNIKDLVPVLDPRVVLIALYKNNIFQGSYVIRDYILGTQTLINLGDKFAFNLWTLNNASPDNIELVIISADDSYIGQPLSNYIETLYPDIVFPDSI